MVADASSLQAAAVAAATAASAEAARLADLRSYRILDTGPEVVFDRITALASRLFRTPIALISLIDEDRQWFKSRQGLATPETPREHAFCDHAIRSDEVLVVEDALQDERFVANPLVTGAPNIRFYAGAPIRTRRGHRLGTVCIIDTRPRQPLDIDGAVALQALAELTSAEFELRHAFLLAKEQAECMQRLNGAILAIERAEALEALPQVAAESARDVLRASHAQVSLDLRAFDGPVAAATVPAPMPDAASGTLDELAIAGARGVFGRIAFARAGGGDQELPSGWSRDVMQTLARAVANRIEQQLLLREASSANERLARVQRLESLGQLTGGVAHDFNNLLTVILGNAEVLAEQLPAPGTAHGLATMIGSAAQRGADLTQRLLAFARRQPLAPVPLDLNQLLSGLLPLLRRSLGEAVEIVVEPGASLWPTRVDPGQLENVLINLGLNARDAMPHGGRLTLHTANLSLDAAAAAAIGDELPPGDHVSLSVSDTGSGIAPEHLHRVFEPFFTTKETGRGTGLGLSTVYGFVKQSGGHVTLQSLPGAGTTVRILLPRWSGSEPAAVPEHAADQLPTGTGQLILLVEDEPLVRGFARAQLDHLGYRVLEAADGHAALALLRGVPDIALLLTDMVMPGGMSGSDVAEQARAWRPELPVLFTTGYTAPELMPCARLGPGVRILGKPYRRAELAQMVHAALARASAGAAATAPDDGAA